MSKTFNKDIQYIFNPQITLPTSSGLTITGNSNTIGNIFTTGGNVGIDTVNPSAGKLHIHSTGGSAAIFSTFLNGASERYWSITNPTSGTDTLVRVNTGNGWNFETDFISRLSIDAVLGNVGIGTTAPAHKLDVVGTIDATTYTGSNIMISGSIGSLGSIDAGSQFLGQANDTISAPSFSWTGDTNTGIYRPLTDQLGFVTNGVERMRVSSAGNIGIGTTAPIYKLDVNGTQRIYSGNGVQMSLSTSNGNFSTIESFTTGNTLKLPLCLNPYGGNVGIGTTAPSTTLDVNGSIKHLGGYAVFGLSTIGYANGTSTLQFGNTQFSSRITNNTSSFTFQDAGIFMIHVKLNSDSTITGVIQLLLQFFNGTSWVTYQTSEDSRAYTGATEFITHYMVEASANQQWRLSFNNASGSTWNFATQTGIDYWSRLMIYKVA